MSIYPDSDESIAQQDSTHTKQITNNLPSPETARMIEAIPSLESLHRLLSGVNLGLLIAAGAVAVAIAFFAVWSSRVSNRLLAAKDEKVRYDLGIVDANAKQDAARIDAAAKERIRKVEIAAQERISKVEHDSGVEIAKSLAVAGQANDRASATEAKNLETSLELEKERVLRKELEASMFPREIPLKVYIDDTTNFDELREYAGTEYILETIADFEARRAATNLGNLLNAAGWKLVRATEINDAPDGVTVESPLPPEGDPMNGDEAWSVAERQSMATRSRALDLIAFLAGNKWDAMPDWGKREELPVTMVRIKVGFHSNPYFTKQLSPELANIMDRVADAKRRMARKHTTGPEKPLKRLIMPTFTVSFGRGK
jgi:hypothetical protein